MSIVEDFKANYFKKGTRKIEPVKVVISLVVAIFLISFYFYKQQDLIYKNTDRKKNLCYTVGITNRRYKNPKSSKPTIGFIFFYKNNRYSGKEHVDAEFQELNLEGKRYYVEFSSIKPDNCKLLLMYPVPDSVQNIPEVGWHHMPGY